MPLILNKSPFQTENTTLEIKDGILFIERHLRSHFTLDHFKKITKERLEYTEGLSYPVIIFGKDMMSIEKSARDYMVNEGSINKLSRAFVVEKTQSKLALQFAIETNEQPIPVQIFEEMQLAIEWSKQYRQG